MEKGCSIDQFDACRKMPCAYTKGKGRIHGHEVPSWSFCSSKYSFTHGVVETCDQLNLIANH